MVAPKIDNQAQLHPLVGAETQGNHPQDLRKIRRRIEDMLRKDEGVLLKVARFLKIA
ncbi:MAG: hypothetical protein PHU44_03895 [Syntrophales bacterium]|nr:hypothetical protein [Syntrophales bacterium]MDD5640576.1 hypothetical protein [Syntrophales bacterium]